MSTRHLSIAMQAAEIMKNGRKTHSDPSIIEIEIRKRKRSVSEIRAMMMQASINRAKDLA